MRISNCQPPKWLGAEARKEFKRLERLLRESGVTHEVDADLLSMYASTWVRWRRAQQCVTDHGETIGRTSKSGDRIIVLRPEARLATELGVRLLGMQRSLRMTPKSRLSRAALTEPCPDDRSLAAAYIHPSILSDIRNGS